MATKDRYYYNLIGTGSTFSEIDIIQINRLYKCPPYNGTMPIRPTPKCHDYTSYCEMRVQNAGCKNSYNKRNCPLTCGICKPNSTRPLPTVGPWPPKPTTLRPDPNCKDESKSCHRHKPMCGTKSWERYLKKYCAKTCKFCIAPSEAPGVTTISPKQSTKSSKGSTASPTVSNKPGISTITVPTTKMTSAVPSVNPTTDSNCKDTANCKNYLDKCKDKAWKWFVSRACRKTCSFCITPSDAPTIATTMPAVTTLLPTTKVRSGAPTKNPTTDSNCKDKGDFCKNYLDKCKDKDWHWFVSRACRKTCKFC